MPFQTSRQGEKHRFAHFVDACANKACTKQSLSTRQLGLLLCTQSLSRPIRSAHLITRDTRPCMTLADFEVVHSIWKRRKDRPNRPNRPNRPIRPRIKLTNPLIVHSVTHSSVTEAGSVVCTVLDRCMVALWSYHQVGSSNVGPASVHTGTTTSSHRVCARLGYLLICTTMCTSLLYTRCSHLLLVCAFLSTRAPGIFVTALSDYSSLKFTNQTGRQSGSQTDGQEIPARECSNDCVLHGHLGLFRAIIFVLSKMWSSQSYFSLAGTRSLSLFCNHPCTPILHHLQASSLSVTHSLLPCMDHGPWLNTWYRLTTAWKGQKPSRVAIPHRHHACHLQPPTHLDRWYAWGRHFILLR